MTLFLMLDKHDLLERLLRPSWSSNCAKTQICQSNRFVFNSETGIYVESTLETMRFVGRLFANNLDIKLEYV